MTTTTHIALKSGESSHSNQAPTITVTAHQPNELPATSLPATSKARTLEADLMRARIERIDAQEKYLQTLKAKQRITARSDYDDCFEAAKLISTILQVFLLAAPIPQPWLTILAVVLLVFNIILAGRSFIASIRVLYLERQHGVAFWRSFTKFLVKVIIPIVTVCLLFGIGGNTLTLMADSNNIDLSIDGLEAIFEHLSDIFAFYVAVDEVAHIVWNHLLKRFFEKKKEADHSHETIIRNIRQQAWQVVFQPEPTIADSESAESLSTDIDDSLSNIQPVSHTEDWMREYTDFEQPAGSEHPNRLRRQTNTAVQFSVFGGSRLDCSHQLVRLDQSHRARYLAACTKEFRCYQRWHQQQASGVPHHTSM